jgi:hypothetical protein
MRIYNEKRRKNEGMSGSLADFLTVTFLSLLVIVTITGAFVAFVSIKRAYNLHEQGARILLQGAFQDVQVEMSGHMDTARARRRAEETLRKLREYDKRP